MPESTRGASGNTSVETSDALKPARATAHVPQRIRAQWEHFRLRDSGLTQRQTELIGVARWPDDRFNREGTLENNRYGRAFFEQSRHLAQKILSGQINSFKDLWGDCRRWRGDYEMKFGGANEKFGLPRNALTKLYRTAIFKDDQYEYVARRIVDAASPFRDRTAGPPRAFAQSGFEVKIDASIPNHVHLAITYQPRILIDGNSMELTRTRVFLETNSEELYIFRPDRPVVGMMLHPNEESMRAFEEKLETLSASLMRRRPDGAIERLDRTYVIDTLADTHWFSVHAMLDSRGSAAKSEMAVRAMAYAQGIELPPFERGIVPDIEAFLRPKSGFRACYRSFLDLDTR